jgi:hypothetical protein
MDREAIIKWLFDNEVIKMKGTVVSYFEKKSKAGKAYLNVQMTVEGNQVQYLCTDDAAIAKVRESVNEEMDFYTFKSKDGTATFMALPKSGTSQTSQEAAKSKSFTPIQDGSRNNSFALSYSKDIVCHCIDKGIVNTSKEIDATLIHYFNLCLGML